MSSSGTDEWRDVDRLLDAALSLPVREREAFVERSDVPARVREHVLRMLDASGAAEALIAESVEALARAVLDDDATVRASGIHPGTSIGPYTVIRELGRGGMGTVYLAGRADQTYDRRVALKVVKRGIDTDEVLERFRREGRILARLEHPGIGRMYDADVTQDGRPYLVLEHIEGERIDEYCDARRLDVDARIRLFLRVCEAVAFAHQQLVLHRDLKPSNILVSADGPRLLDFGIAKILDEGDGEGTSLTSEVGQRLTPEYASPEQVAGTDVSTASDVYALGVVLHELLTGLRPSRGDRHTASSTVTESGPGRDAETLATVRQSTPRRLSKRLRGDLDRILTKALHEDVERRYPTVEAFASDLQNHLSGFPVTAQPDSITYRVGKFVRRNRLPVFSGAGTMASVVMFALASFLQQAETARERDRANSERARAEEVADVLEELFTGAGVMSPDRIDTLTVRQLLDSSAEEVLQDLERQPVVQGTLLRILGAAQLDLGRLDESDRLLERSVAVLEVASPADPRALAAAKAELGHLRSRQGRWDEARGLFRDFFQADPEATPSDSAEVYVGLATTFFEEARYDSATAWLDRSLVVFEGRPDLDPVAHAAALNMGGVIAQRRGDLEEALDRAERAWKMMADARGPDHPSVFGFEHNYAFMVSQSGRAGDAEPAFRSLIGRMRPVVGDSPALASALHNYAEVLRLLGRSDEALPLVREALGMRRSLLGSDHPEVTYSLDALGTTLEALDRHDDALPAFLEFADVSASAYGPDHPATAVARMKVASASCSAGNAEERVVQRFGTAERSIRASFPAGHLAVTDFERRKGRCYARLGRDAEAIEALAAAVAGLEAHGGRQAALESARAELEELRRRAGSSGVSPRRPS